MGHGSGNPGEWDAGRPGEPPAQLLRRAISHVESLLHRLETPEPSRATVADLPDDERAPSDDALEHPHPPAPGESTPAPPTGNVVELSRPEPQPAAPRAEPAAQAPHEPAEVVAMPGLGSTAQAEALRITLRAREEANRLRAEANGLRAEAAAEGERILVEARLLSDRLHAESRESATELLQAARTEAAAIVSAARAEAEQERAGAKAAALEELAREAERIRAEAREAGQAEAARLVEAEVEAAAAEGRRALETSRSRAQELLTTAHGGIEDVRASMQRLLEEMNAALVAFNAAVGSIEQIDDAVAELAPAVQAGPGEDGRRPLGLLFGAPRG